MDEKLCSKCKTLKTLDQFGPDRRTTTGKQSECISCRKQRSKEYYSTEKGKKWKRDNHRMIRGSLRHTIVMHYGGRCKACGVSDARVLDIDHVENDGALQRKLMTPLQFMRMIVKEGFPERYQILCRNCNWIRYLEAKGTIPLFQSAHSAQDENFEGP